MTGTSPSLYQSPQRPAGHGQSAVSLRTRSHCPPAPQQTLSGTGRLQLTRQPAGHTRFAPGKMFRKPAANVRLYRRQHEGVRRAAAGLKTGIYGDVRRRDASSSSSSSSSSSTVMGESVKLRCMDELHGPSLLTSLRWLFVKGYFQTTQQMQIEHTKIYGPLWKSKFGPLVVVNVASADLIEQVLRQEGRHPVRTDMPHWRGYRELRNQAHGPLTEMGAKWQRIRSILNPRMLKPKHVSSYTNTINDVVTDFINRVAWLKETRGQGVMVNDLTGELYKFAFEGICSVLFESRMGCMNDVVPEKTQKFITSVGEMFRLSQVVILFPKSTWPYLPFWKQFVAAWDNLFKVSEELVMKKMEEIQEKVDLDQNLEGAYLTHLLLSDKMTVTEILGSITELLLAGVDTTSNTVSWCLYLLAKEPAIQEQLYQEVISVCPGDNVPTSDDISQMPYMKAIIRETLRLYPVVPGNARVTLENDIVVGDYLFPKKTLFHLCHYAVSYDENIFPDPHAFLPQRWLRVAEEKSKQHPFGSVPFGFGIRACLGRRVAELEMYLLLSRLIKHFEVRPDPAGTTVKAITRTLLCPAKPINLQFLDRRVEREEPRAAAGVSL
uniref:Sterol 26-hydroxylase mitochondrial-like protein n=1 Tax=Lateolabrax maculatus TaxID=315492 RepID=A0A7T7FRQ4_LATMC|nr:sterol 26-hydroxylase mitochondrial-like protein [Lateolabrax maculatus]